MTELIMKFNNCTTDEDLEQCIVDIINSGGKAVGHELDLTLNMAFVYCHIETDLAKFFDELSKTESYKKWER